ncbi:MAG: hypothetical protein KDJ73_07015 [Notoacmeibacter sp.]|nr:hypothetical protein [Notoacmeibacter sp.]MCC0033558.1 hypothetical protein [Brucellaceae bacterium]
MAMTAGNGWAVARAWAERLPFDYATLADIAGVTEMTVRSMARRQGWRVRGAGDARETLLRMRERLWARVDLLTATEPQEPFDKAGIEAVQVLMRALDRIEQLLPEGTEPENATQAGELAAVLRRIDERIMELARELAAQRCGDHGRVGQDLAGVPHGE